ncbi:MAG TPA: methyltransferase domain-containing protein [Thermomicrobiales bacterium]|nr:methyltransferase domain-containing protein [Thermomicrobiales bacterium]
MTLARLAARAFDLLYGPGAPVYDLVARAGFAGEWARWQRTALRFVHEGPVLELGPGTGDLLPVLAAQGLRPCGLEPSARMLARARRKYARRGVAAPPLVRGRAEALPFAAGAFGAVVATFPSGYILRPATWAEIARVLRPGGDVAVVLGGELAPDSPGRAQRARAYRVLYGDQEAHPPPLPDSPLAPRLETVATAHGRAFLLVGRKSDE